MCLNALHTILYSNSSTNSLQFLLNIHWVESKFYAWIFQVNISRHRVLRSNVLGISPGKVALPSQWTCFGCSLSFPIFWELVSRDKLVSEYECLECGAESSAAIYSRTDFQCACCPSSRQQITSIVCGWGYSASNINNKWGTCKDLWWSSHFSLLLGSGEGNNPGFTPLPIHLAGWSGVGVAAIVPAPSHPPSAQPPLPCWWLYWSSWPNILQRKGRVSCIMVGGASWLLIPYPCLVSLHCLSLHRQLIPLFGGFITPLPVMFIKFWGGFFVCAKLESPPGPDLWIIRYSDTTVVQGYYYMVCDLNY